MQQYEPPASSDLLRDSQPKIANTFGTLRSSFSGSISPPNPVEGQLWWDTTNNQLLVYNGTDWVRPPVLAHNVTHSKGGIDEVSIQGLPVDTGSSLPAPSLGGVLFYYLPTKTLWVDTGTEMLRVGPMGMPNEAIVDTLPIVTSTVGVTTTAFEELGTQVVGGFNHYGLQGTTVTGRFVAAIRSSVAGETVTAEAYDLTFSTPLTNSQVITTNSSFVALESVECSLPATSSVITVRAKAESPGVGVEVQAASLMVLSKVI